MILMLLDATKGDKQKYVRNISFFFFLSSLQTKLFFLYLFSREILEAELETVGIRLNRRKPDIYFKVHLIFREKKATIRKKIFSSRRKLAVSVSPARFR